MSIAHDMTRTPGCLEGTQE